MELSTKIIINPNFEQIDVLMHLSEECRLLYNYCLSEKLKLTKSYGKNIPYKTQKKHLHPLREKEPHYNIVNVKVLQRIIKKVDVDYKEFYRHYTCGNYTVNPPKFKGKKYFMNMLFDRKNTSFELKDGQIILLHKHSNIKLNFDIPEQIYSKNINSIEVINTRPYKINGEFVLKINFEKNEKKFVDNKKYQAFDLGNMKIVTAINTNGKVIEVWNKRVNKYWDLKIRKAKERLEGCKKYSNRWLFLKNKISKMIIKKKNSTNDYFHKTAHKIVNNTKANTLIVGDMSLVDLKMEKGFSNLHFGTQNNIYLINFIELLTYKAKLIGKKVVKIDESYTSKECFVCGKLHTMTVHDREYTCECGNVIDRDVNSSINIMLRYLSQNANWTGYQQFVGNLRKTGLLTNEKALVRIPKRSPKSTRKFQNVKDFC